MYAVRLQRHHVIGVKDGKKAMQTTVDGYLNTKDKLGSITGMAETENGFVATDGNMREIQFWAKDGTHIGAISTDDIFGVSYPWLEDMQLLDDGSLLIMVTQERDDGSANEFFCCLHFQTYGTCGGIWGICILHLKDIK